jgi:hypothetical protein
LRLRGLQVLAADGQVQASLVVTRGHLGEGADQ